MTAWERIVQSSRGSSIPELVAKVLGVAMQLARAPLALRACDRVGRRARAEGSPRIRNDGTIVLGDDVILLSRWNPIQLACAAGGRIEVGSGTHVNFGTLVAARRLVRVGERVQIGPHGILSDTESGDPFAPSGEAAPIEIGDDVWLAARVTVLPGARIGAGSVVTAGSVVAGEIPPGVVAGGIPARILRRAGAAPEPARGVARPLPPSEPAAAPDVRGVLIADFTVDDLARLLRDPSERPIADARVAGFGQVAQALLAGPPADASDFAVVWTRPEAAVPAFARVLAHEAVEDHDLEQGVDAFCALLERGAAAWKHVFVPTWTRPPDQRGLGMIDARRGGAARALARMNVRLMDALAGASNVYVLDAQRWTAAGGRGAQNPKSWLLGKVAFGDAVLAEAARDVKAALRGASGGARKLVVLDLDDTLWGGIVGDVGWEALRLGGHDAVGEAYVAFQRALVDLTRRGILLAVVSKNEEATALEAIRSHPEMVLRTDDLVAWRIDWQDKARNVADIAAELNLGLQSVVFIDDNPAERGRVKETLPEVLVPEWPQDPLLYPTALAQLRCFDQPAITREDAERTRLYASERAREQSRTQVGSLDEWLAGLGIVVRLERLGPANLARAAQLLNKTNQMNLTTRRLSEQELAAWARERGRRSFTVSVSDRFGDAGLTGLLSVEADGSVARVVDYVLSCRVMGRKVEQALIHVAVETARQDGLGALEARLVPTKKNRPCAEAWAASGLARSEPELFRWDTAARYPLPSCIRLEWPEEAR